MADTTTPIPHSQRAVDLLDRLRDASNIESPTAAGALAATAQAHALLAIGEAIHTQTKMLRQLLEPLSDLVDAVTVIAVRVDGDGPVIVTGPEPDPDQLTIDDFADEADD